MLSCLANDNKDKLSCLKRAIFYNKLADLQTYEKNLKRQRKRQDYLMLQLETRHLDAEPPIFLRIHETSIC